MTLARQRRSFQSSFVVARKQNSSIQTVCPDVKKKRKKKGGKRKREREERKIGPSA